MTTPAIHRAFAATTRAALELGGLGERALTPAEAERLIDSYGLEVFGYVLRVQTDVYAEREGAAEEAAAAISYAMRGAQ